MNPLLVDSYDYPLPESLIASYPADPKDSCKLLVYDRKKDQIFHTIFKNIAKFIPKDTAILFNDTKVIKARIYGKKTSGGKIELLFNSPLQNDTFLAYIRGKVKEDTILLFDENLKAKVLKLNDDGTRIVKFYQDDLDLNFHKLTKVLEKIGHIPLPPYIKREDKKSDEKDYQTLFADKEGAVAAPTASLHFTDQLFEDICSKYNTGYLTLHVGAGTFKPVEAKSINDHVMHSEFFEIPQKTQNIINSNKNILAVGTTVTRTIEYYARNKTLSGEANIFLHPLNKPIRVNHLLTNFHLPKSTLLMLVASFVGVEKTLELYKVAVERKYRFFSYGDTMLIL